MRKPKRRLSKSAWASLTQQTRPGTRLLAIEMVDRLGISRATLHNYARPNNPTPLPTGWRIARIGSALVFERTE